MVFLDQGGIDYDNFTEIIRDTGCDCNCSA